MMRERYTNPFSGKFTPIELGGLFLLAPSVELKLAGHPIRTVFVKMGKESLFKGIERSVKRRIAPTPKLLASVVSISKSVSFHEDAVAAVQGDKSAQKRIDEMGLWEAYLKGEAAASGKELPASRRFVLEIERACARPLQLVHECRFNDAVTLLAADPLMRNFLWAEAINLFTNCKDETQLLSLRASVALEVHLSVIAAWDTGFVEELESSCKSAFFLNYQHRMSRRKIRAACSLIG